MQVEYATDVIFRSREALQPIYETLIHTAIHAVKPDSVAMFLGRKYVHGNFGDEVGTNFETRIQGTRIKHHMGPASIKMYDKFGQVPATEKVAPLKKSIYSLKDLRDLLRAANKRYLDFISALDDPSVGMGNLTKVAEVVTHAGRTYKGFNFFSLEDQRLFETIARGEFTISGLRNKDIRARIPERPSGWISRCLKRLRTHGLIKAIGRTYKYYLTDLGRRVVTTGLKVKELVVIPMLAAPT